jgi:hypothetical protein
MDRALRVLAFAFLMSCCALPARATEGLAKEGLALERGVAIIDPSALRELDHSRFGLTRIMAPARSADTPLTNSQLFALASMAPVRKALDEEFERYVARHKAELPSETIGVGSAFDFQLFDRALLDSADTRFVLSGIVNRMDRAYVLDKSCGEIRLIYRLTRIAAPSVGELDASPRLPMTLNVVMKAKRPGDVDIGCAEIARRWLGTAGLMAAGAELAEKLTAKDGALASLGPANIDRIETNLQIAHAPKSAVRDFRTDYLMKVFDYDPSSASFIESPLENQIDRARLLSDQDFARDFKSWLLDPVHFEELDRGTVAIPDRFLLKGAVAVTPVGFAASALQPAFGLVAGEDGTKTPVFSGEDVVTALKNLAARGVAPLNIRSAAGFERRLNDMSCTGCHQTRGIGGFHFPGVDWMAAHPSNATIVPASPHFFGDQIRRRDILTSIRDGQTPDFSRGFSERPQLRGSRELAGTEYQDGWGAHCYAQHTKASDNDRSYTSWTCAKGLACQIVSEASRMGMCFVGGR